MRIGTTLANGFALAFCLGVGAGFVALVARFGFLQG